MPDRTTRDHLAVRLLVGAMLGGTAGGALAAALHVAIGLPTTTALAVGAVAGLPVWAANILDTPTNR